MNNEENLIKRKNEINSRLEALIDVCEIPQKRLLEAMKYSLMAGGKRIRGILTLEFCEACGGESDDALDFACAVEMLHAYSLIHDDLPCMDNDSIRRGKPTNHIVFGEWLALLAGDALQAEAFSVITGSKLSPEQIAKAAEALGNAAGWRGICGGQYLDLDGEGKSLSEENITLTHKMKTAALIEAACEMGCIAAGADARRISAAKSFGSALGLAFQIRDDILDYIGNEAELGKSTGKDQNSEKCTFVSAFGLEHCIRLVDENTEKAICIAEESFEKPEFLCWLTKVLADRNN